ncbi:putative ribonuclease h protein [Quercus suber]|uniref:Ribonuclease h protein n=1 Tax=Quercus suber TaxID=58331 RepID=A0AAW0J1J1_QUESU
MENSKSGGWADVLSKKYMVRHARKPKAHTRAWNAVKIGISICEKGSKWTVDCNSSLSFWNDKWLNIGTIRSLIEGPLNQGESEVCIKEVTMDTGIAHQQSLSGSKQTALHSLKKSFSDDLVVWIKKNALDSSKVHGKNYEWCTFFLLGLWNLWLQRNRMAFKQQPPNPNLVRVVEMQTRELLYCVLEPNTGKDRHLKQVQWLKPSAGWHKLNTDGSVVSTIRLSGCGGLLRDCTGQWVVGFAKSINASSSIAAELWALKEGLGLCLDRGISAVEIELDATAAISLVSSNVNTNGDLSGLVDDCKELLLCLPQVKLSHCFRKANFCADVLAKLGSTSADLSLVFVPPLPVILQPLYDDMMGVCRSRLCTTGASASVS